jgi:hypothetical protein
MKYFKADLGTGMDVVFVLFNCEKQGQTFVNYLKSVLPEHTVSRLYNKSEAIDWWRGNKHHTEGYALVYGRFVEVDIVQQFMELMED